MSTKLVSYCFAFAAFIYLINLERVDSASTTYVTSMGNLTLNATDDFNCTNRKYGYYADMATDCQIFHFCWSLTNTLTNEKTSQRITYKCPKGYQFDQNTLSCLKRIHKRIPCNSSDMFYESSNSLFFNYSQPTINHTIPGVLNYINPKYIEQVLKSSEQADPHEESYLRSLYSSILSYFAH